jgi:hypothetical protein
MNTWRYIPENSKLQEACYLLVVLGGLVVSVIAIGPKVTGFKPGSNPQHTFLQRGCKAAGPIW